MVTIKEMQVVEKNTKTGYIGYMQPILPTKILGWISDNTLCKSSNGMPAVNAVPMVIATAMPFTGHDGGDISMEKHEIPVLVPSLAVKQDDGTWNVYTNVVFTFEVKYDKGDNDSITETCNMKIMSKSNCIKTSLTLFDLFSAFDW